MKTAKLRDVHVLKLGHHGSTMPGFLAAVDPRGRSD